MKENYILSLEGCKYFARYALKISFIFLLLVSGVLIALPGDMPEPFTAIFIYLFAPPIIWASTRFAMIFAQKRIAPKWAFIFGLLLSYLFSALISGFVVNGFFAFIMDDNCACGEPYNFLSSLKFCTIFWLICDFVFFTMAAKIFLNSSGD